MTDVTTEPEHPRPTTASIDRRVERLEAAQAATDRKVDELSLKVGYMKDMIDMRFTSMESTVSMNSQKLDSFILKIESLITEAMKNAGDLRAQPLGRQIDDRLIALETLIEDHDKIIDETRGFGVGFRQYIFPSVALVVSVSSLLYAVLR